MLQGSGLFNNNLRARVGHLVNNLVFHRFSIDIELTTLNPLKVTRNHLAQINSTERKMKPSYLFLNSLKCY